MKTLTLHIPDTIELDEQQALLILATRMYDSGQLSLGQAAELVDLSKQEFMDQLGKHGVSLFGETIEDIDRDLRDV